MTGNEVNETAMESGTGQNAGPTPETNAEPAADPDAAGPAVEQASGAGAARAAGAGARQTDEATAGRAIESVAEPERKTVRRVFGRVVTNGADKTVAVSIERVVKHPVYGKYIRRTSKVLAHDQDNACEIGDLVAIAECRPLSKRKSWRVVDVIGSNGASQ